MKLAADVTEKKLESANNAGQIAAINKSQAVIEFEMDGTIISANENFLGTMGYSLSEVQGMHHSMFVEPDHQNTAEYSQFWADLGKGHFQAAEYKRIGKGGRKVTIQASYNPILDLSGKPFKVVKLAIDVTAQANARRAAAYIGDLMETVAASSEALNTSIREITTTMAMSKDRTAETFDLVVEADQSTKQLSEAAKSMGGIVDVINNISGQINLLALNATIESARAGEAGKGFAVVANEVKLLAGKTTSATQEISDSIDGMRAMADSVVNALNSIRNAMKEVLEHVTSTAAAVEEQSAVATDISANTQQAANEARRIGTD